MTIKTDFQAFWQPVLCFCVGLILTLSSSLMAKEQTENSPALLAELAQRQSVGQEVVAALGENQQVRVYVGMRSRKADKAARLSAINLTPRDSFQLMREFKNVSGFAGMADAAAVDALSRNPDVWRVDLDAGGSAIEEASLSLARLDVVKAKGFNGAGVTVAIIDTGIDTDHPDLADSLVGQQCFCSGGPCCPNGLATQSGAGAAEDDQGHGTHISGIITGNGVFAPEGGAPGADLVVVKVLDSAGSSCCSSDVIAALDWIISNRPDVDVVNISLATLDRYVGNCDTATSFTSDYSTAINALRAKGVAVIAGSGNNGSGIDMGAPACIANAISVGAVWDSDAGSVTLGDCTDVTTAADQVTCFSNSSTTTDIFAPGGPYTSTYLGGTFATGWGTSMATAVATACVALLRERKPGLSPADLETILEKSPTLVTDSTNGLSFPRLDCADALENFIFESGWEQP